MDKYEKRRLALVDLIEELGRGGVASVAFNIGKDPSYVSRMLYEPEKPGRKRIGEDSWDALVTAYPQLSGELPHPVKTTDYLRVQHLDVEAGMGGERINADHPEVIREMEISHAYIRALLGFIPTEGRLRLITGRGDSMMPTIEPGEMLLIDTGTSHFEYDAIYAIHMGHGLQVKRLVDMGTAIQVRSDNPMYPAFNLPESARILGKVILRNRLERLG